MTGSGHPKENQNDKASEHQTFSNCPTFYQRKRSGLLSIASYSDHNDITQPKLITMHLNLQHLFTDELPGDPLLENTRRQVKGACYSYVTPQPLTNPSLIHASEPMADAIGINLSDIKSEAFLNTFSGSTTLAGSKPYAMCYGGHQFGHWAGQLGDGRAINLGQVTHDDETWTLQLKGAGATPYSRTADGKAVLRSSVREYLCSEAMYYLGVPTTRALSLILTGDKVMRDVMYDGNPALEKGAVVCRVAPSFIRFGNFEIFAARQDHDTLTTLVDYTIKHHYPHLVKPSKETYVAFLQEVSDKTLEMVVHWQRVGFVHGVMNTDNLSILGLTIDYGPYGWLEGYDYNWTPNTTDRRDKRYRYGNQPNIALWNLAKLANALYPLINEAAPLEAILKSYKDKYEVKALQMMLSKLGLTHVPSKHESDIELINTLKGLLHATETDMTIFFRSLSGFDIDRPDSGLDMISEAFYSPDEVDDDLTHQWNEWFVNYGQRLVQESIPQEDRQVLMNQVNPKYVLRNYMAQLAIDDADKGDYTLIDELYTMLQKPYDEQPEHHKWYAKRPEWARHKVGCSMLSCSS